LTAAPPAITQAAVLWSLSVAPSSATQNESTVFKFTASDLDVTARLGCLDVDFPPSFVIEALGTPTASNGVAWVSSQIGNTVVAHSTTGGGRLNPGQTVTFTVTASPGDPGAFLFTTHGHAQQDCTGVELPHAPLAFTVLPAPKGTPIPTPITTPDASTPVPTPTPRPNATPTPGESVPAADPSPTPDPADSARSSPVAPKPSPAASGSGGTIEVRVAPLGKSPDGGSDNMGTGLDGLAMLDGPFVWFVPGAAVGVPGLLVIVFVVLQGVGALAWIPAVRRLGGDKKRRRQPRRPARPA
jgi:predicted RNA-binding protein with TRAM domain